MKASSWRGLAAVGSKEHVSFGLKLTCVERKKIRRGALAVGGGVAYEKVFYHP